MYIFDIDLCFEINANVENKTLNRCKNLLHENDGCKYVLKNVLGKSTKNTEKICIDSK